MTIIDVEQGSQKWRQLRIFGGKGEGCLTASRMGSILTPKQRKMGAGAITVACEMVADLWNPYADERESYVTAAMRNGLAMEPEARGWLELQGHTVQHVGFCLSDCGRFGCSPDSLLGDDCGLELKSPEPKTHIKWLYDGGMPVEHIGQVHGGMVVTGRRRWKFMSWCPPFPELEIDIEWDEYTQALSEALEPFWQLYCDIRRKAEAGMTLPQLDEHFVSYW